MIYIHKIKSKDLHYKLSLFIRMDEKYQKKSVYVSRSNQIKIDYNQIIHFSVMFNHNYMKNILSNNLFILSFSLQFGFDPYARLAAWIVTQIKVLIYKIIKGP
jgi:hypothetical protein